MARAYVIGSGPNGLAAAIVLAQAGLEVEVFEAAAEPGGAVRTLPLTLPGFLHDFGASVFPMGAGSPFFKTLPLADHGLEWVHGEAPLGHPLEDGSAVMLERGLDDAVRELGADGARWRGLMAPLVADWDGFAEDALGPMLRVPRHPLRMARFGWTALQSAKKLAWGAFGDARTRALFAGLAGHSFLSLERPLSSAIGLVLGAAGHAVGWPVARGGAGALTRALTGHFCALGGRVRTGTRVDARLFKELAGGESLLLCDMTPRALAALAGERATSGFQRAAERFERGPGVFKVDYALSEAVPWRAAECRRAMTVHLGGSFEEIATAEEATARGRVAERPFVLVTQPSLFDATRAPRGKHVLWAYCHVPNGSAVDMTARIEGQMERFAPGFRECVLERRIWAPGALEGMDANLEGGDIGGGAFTVRQFLFRPWARSYATGVKGIYLCSASTPPGGAVHGMCGYHAARAALDENRSHRAAGRRWKAEAP